MRKRNPNDVIIDFQSDVQVSLEEWSPVIGFSPIVDVRWVEPMNPLAHFPARCDTRSMELVRTDGRSRVVLPGHSDEMFLMRENPDGSILLEPAVLVSKSQLEYDQDPELRELLAKAAASPTVRRNRRKRQR